MPNQHNQQQVKLIQEKVKQAKSVAVVDYSGTSVTEMTQLRADLRDAGGEILVTKNTLIDIALGKGKVSDSLTGMNAIVFSYPDAVSAIKKLFGFHQNQDRLTIKQGYMPEEDKILSVAEVETLSQLPSKHELIATLLRVLKSPASGMINILKANQRHLVLALKGIADQKAT